MVNRQRYGRPLFAIIVVALLAGMYAVASSAPRVATARQPVSAVRASVSTATRVCAAPGSAAPTSASIALTAIPATAKSGRAVISPLTPAGSASPQPALATLTEPDLLQLRSVAIAPPLTKAEATGQPGSTPQVSTQAGRGGVEVVASGAMAQGLQVEQTGPGGLSTAQCGTPGTDFWFAGPGQAIAGTVEVYLMNSGSQPADARITVLTDVTKGPPLLANADSGITVPPHGMVVQSLSRLLQSSKVVALNVTTSVGQVTAAVRESRSAAHDGSWLPATGSPARHLVIPGLPGTAGSRELYIAVPGGSSAEVKVAAVTEKGSYQPTGGGGIALLGGSAVTIALPSLGGIAGAVSVTSTVPVVAAMLIPGGPAGASGTVLAAAGAIEQQGVLAVNPARTAGTTQLVLSAPAKAARVRIGTATASAPATGSGTIVTIKAGTSLVVSPRPQNDSKASAFSLVLTPLSGSGPVYAARVISVHGTLQSILAVPSSLTWIAFPPVRDSIAAALR